MKKILIFVALCFVCFATEGQAADLDRAIIVFSADDAEGSAYSVVYPIMQMEGMNFTAYMVTSLINSPGHITWDQAWEIYMNGNEIGNHGEGHMDYTGKSYTQIYNDIKNAKRSFRSHGFTQVVSFAYPFGIKNERVVRALTALGLTSSRGAWDDYDIFNIPATFNRWWIESWSFRNTPGHNTFADAKMVIDEAIEGRKMLSIKFHDVYPNAPGEDDLDYYELYKTVEYVAQQRNARLVDVGTVGAAVEKMNYYKLTP